MRYYSKVTGYTLLFLTVFIFLFPLGAIAKEIHFDASVERNVIALGQGVQLNLEFEDTRDVSRPDLPAIDGFQVRYRGPSSMMSIVNGRMSSSITHVFTLIPLKTGTFTLGPFSFDYNGDTYTSNPVKLEVVDSAAGNTRQGKGQDRAQQSRQMDLKDRVFVVMKALKNRAYVNETVLLTVKLYVRGLAVRDIQYPELEQDGFSMEEFGKPKQYQENRNGVVYDVIEFNTKVFGTRKGTFTIGPAVLKANILVRSQGRGHSPFGRGMFDDFFGGYETYPLDLRSDKMSFTVLPFPEKEKPVGFTGAIGDFDLAVSASPSQVQEGDPVTVRMIVSGKGNFNTVSAPRLEQSDNMKVYEPQVTQKGDRKVFEQVLIPLSDSVREVPAVTFSYFDPGKGTYRTITKDHIPITVTKRENEEKITMVEASPGGERIVTKEKLGKDIVYIKEAPGRLKKKGGYLYKDPLFLIAQFVPIVLFIAALIFQRKRERLRTDSAYARRLSAPRKARKGIASAQNQMKAGDAGEFYGSVYRTLQEYIGDRYHLPAGGITADIIDIELKDKGIDHDVLDRLKVIFKECDAARYAPSGIEKAGMEQTLQYLREVIDHMERSS